MRIAAPRLSVVLFLSALLSSGHVAAQSSGSEGPEVWPAWRGPAMDGLALGANIPVEFSESTNVRWKVEIPGRGASTPVIWEDTIFLTFPDGARPRALRISPTRFGRTRAAGYKRCKQKVRRTLGILTEKRGISAP